MATANPFPGMDPWLEPIWAAVHPPYIAHLYQQLAARLPPDLFARLERDVYVVADDTRGQLHRPDVAAFDVADTRARVGRRPAQRGGSTLAVAEPISVRFTTRTVTLSHVAVRDATRNRRLVTAVELISPTNKGRAREQWAYRNQRDDYLTAAANVVEIDLLRGGADLLDVSPADLPPGADATYRACVRVADPDLSDRGELYPIGLRQRLPTIAVPLRAGDDDAALDLQSALDDVYQTGRLDLDVDHAAPPVPPADAAWAAERIAAGRSAGV